MPLTPGYKRLTIRGLNGPHVIVYDNNEIVTLQSTPVVELPEGLLDLEIYKCKRRSFDRVKRRDIYERGQLFTKITVSIPDEDTIYV